MKIAIAMKNEQEIQTGHFGQARFYLIYEMNGGSAIFKEKRENPLFRVHEHAKAEEIQQVVGDCGVWIGVRMGKESIRYLCDAGITPFVVTASTPDKAIEEYSRYAVD